MANWTEEQRLTVLHQHDVLDTGPEQSFDEIVEAAAKAFGAPIAAVSLVDSHRQWFKARIGLDVSETPRDISFCTHTVEGARSDHALLVVPDARRDPRFAANPLVTADPNLRFYAGAVIRSEEGLPLGTLCVIDTVARPAGFTEEQAELLLVFADQVSEQLRLRRLVERHVGREHRLLRALHSGAVGWWEWDVRTDTVVGNIELARDFGIDAALVRDGAPIAQFFANVHPLDRPGLEHAVKEAIATGEPFREEYRVVHPDGRTIWISARGACLRDETGEPSSFPGVIIDITERREAERRLREVDLRRELAMSAARLGSWDHDPQTNIRRYDARGLELFGLTAEEAPDLANSYAVLHPDDREPMRRAAAAAMDPERSGPFRETFRVVDRKTGDIRWLSAIGRTEFSNGVCTRFVGVLDDVTEEKSAEAHRLLLVNELNHRVKNNLAVVASIVNASLRSATDLAAARDDINSRLQSLGRAHDLLTAESWVSADVATVVAHAVETLSLPADRVTVAGPDVRLLPKPALQLSLALHELGTNAVKYGALSGPGLDRRGGIAISWAVADGQFAFRWTEADGPTVAIPTRRGFGTRLIEAATAAEFRGASRLDYRPAGLEWTLDAPLAGIEAG